MRIYFIFFFSFLLLTGCKNNSSSEEIKEKTYSIFPIINGMNFDNQNENNITNSNGEFSTFSNQPVSFYLGKHLISTLNITHDISFLELSNSTSFTDIKTINLTKLLVALDTDHNSNNGIQLKELSNEIIESLNRLSELNLTDNTVTDFLINNGYEAYILDNLEIIDFSVHSEQRVHYIKNSKTQKLERKIII